MTTSHQDDTCIVSFFTTVYPVAVSDTEFAIPVATKPKDLTALINKLLDLETPTRFLFLHEETLLTCSLGLYMKKKGLSKERVLRLEYVPALSEKENARVPHDDWVSSVQTLEPSLCATLDLDALGITAASPIVLSAAYDGAIRVCSGTTDNSPFPVLALGSAHSGPATAVRAFAGVPLRLADRAPPKRRKSGAADSKKQGVLFAISCGRDGIVKGWENALEESAPQDTPKTARKLSSKKSKAAPVPPCPPAPFSLRSSVSLGLSQAPLTSVAISPGNVLCAAGAMDGTVYLFPPSALSAGDAAAAAVGKSHARAVFACCFGADAATLASAGADGDLRVWDVAASEAGGTLADPAVLPLADDSASAIYCLAVHGQNLWLTGHADHRVRLWDTRAGSSGKQHWFGHSGWVYDVAWHQDGRRTSQDGLLCVWDTRASLPLLRISPHATGRGILGVDWVAGDALASGGKDRMLALTKLEVALV